jgi:CTP synthase (UTP-ammonia lyase)
VAGWQDPAMPSIALLGDRSEHRSHRELDALVPRLLDELGVEARWLPTERAAEVAGHDGVWLVPGSPYADDAAVLEALRLVRTGGVPFLGTCGGMQYAVVELTRGLLGRSATHAESDGEADDNVVTALACSLQGEERLVSPVPGSRFATWCPEPFVGMHFCGFAPTAEAVAALAAHGVRVGATAPDAGAEEIELDGHPFYVASLFQPHVGALAGEPIHPLVRAFADAVTGRT